MKLPIVLLHEALAGQADCLHSLISETYITWIRYVLRLSIYFDNQLTHRACSSGATRHELLGGLPSNAESVSLSWGEVKGNAPPAKFLNSKYLDSDFPCFWGVILQNSASYLP